MKSAGYNMGHEDEGRVLERQGSRGRQTGRRDEASGPEEYEI